MGYVLRNWRKCSNHCRKSEVLEREVFEILLSSQVWVFQLRDGFAVSKLKMERKKSKPCEGKKVREHE